MGSWICAFTRYKRLGTTIMQGCYLTNSGLMICVIKESYHKPSLASYAKCDVHFDRQHHSQTYLLNVVESSSISEFVQLSLGQRCHDLPGLSLLFTSGSNMMIAPWLTPSFRANSVLEANSQIVMGLCVQDNIRQSMLLRMSKSSKWTWHFCPFRQFYASFTTAPPN